MNPFLWSNRLAVKGHVNREGPVELLKQIVQVLLILDKRPFTTKSIDIFLIFPYKVCCGYTIKLHCESIIFKKKQEKNLSVHPFFLMMMIIMMNMMMVWSFTSISTLFNLYQDNGSVIIKGSVR